MANISTGANLSATNFNALFKRLDDIRAKHLNKDGQNATANSTFRTAFTTNVAVAGEKAIPNNIQRVKDTLTTLSQSEWIDATPASSITVPNVGDLISANTFNTIDNTITTVEAICPNYTRYAQYRRYGQYGEYSVYGQYSNFSNYYQYGNYYRYGNYYQYSNRTR